MTNTPVNKKGTGSSKENGYGGGGNSSIEVLRCRNSRSNTMFIYPLRAVYIGEVLFFVYFFSCLFVACENIRFSSLFAAGDVSRGGNVPSGEERRETDVFAGQRCLHLAIFGG